MDTIQDAYIKAYQNIDKLQDPEKFIPWMKSIARHKALDYKKLNKKDLFREAKDEEGNVSSEEEFLEDMEPAHLPELALEQSEVHSNLQMLLDTLSDEQRICMLMFYYEGMSVKEIAAELQVSENTIKSRLNYGRRGIKNKVEEMEKKGIKLFGLAPLPFFIALLLQDSINVQAAELMQAQVLAGVQQNINQASTGNTTQTGENNADAEDVTQAGTSNPSTGSTTQIGGNIMKKAGLSHGAKIAVGITSALVIGGGAIFAGVHILGNNQEPVAEENA